MMVHVNESKVNIVVLSKRVPHCGQLNWLLVLRSLTASVKGKLIEIDKIFLLVAFHGLVLWFFCNFELFEDCLELWLFV